MNEAQHTAPEVDSITSAFEFSKENFENQKPLLIQPKLSVGAVDDPFEREADSMADRVMRMPDSSFIQRKCASCEEEEKINRMPEPSFLQKKCAACEHEEEEQIHRKITPFIQKQGNGLEGGTASESVTNQINSSRGGGNRMSENTLSFMESRFNTDFSGVKIHTDANAVQMSRELNAQAFTVGSDIYFNSGKYAPESASGKHLLAHELTHTVQQGGGIERIEKTIQRFGSKEHIAIGNNSVPNTNIYLRGYKGTISYGEMIALAGDYFESIDEMIMLVEVYGDYGIRQIDYARWKVNPSGKSEPNDTTAKEAVLQRYFKLASRNETHFSTGSSGGNSNKEMYIKYHEQAILAAYGEYDMVKNLISPRADSVAIEAFGVHYLTDAFSAGHVRTKRGDIKQHFKAIYPNFSSDLENFIGCYMGAYINDVDNVGYIKSVDDLSEGIKEEIGKITNGALSAFDIADMISMILHDNDNNGLDVISNSSTSSSGINKWRAVGDGHLFDGSKEANDTKSRVEKAVTLSYEEVKKAKSAGYSKKEKVSSFLGIQNYQAITLLPNEDINSSTNLIFNWKVSKIENLPPLIKQLVTDSFQKGSIFDEIKAIPVADIIKSGFQISAKGAWECLKSILLKDPIGTLSKIGNKDTCPSGKNNPCPK